MGSKRNVGALLDQQPVAPVIRRGGDFEFTGSEATETEPQISAPEETQNNIAAEKQKSADVERKSSAKAEKKKTVAEEKTERTKIGWAIRTDYITAIKTLAVQRRVRDYEIIEEALQQYLKQKPA